MAASLIAKRRNCMICGGAYQVPPEAEAQIKALQSPPPQGGKTLNITCPVCFHPFRYANILSGMPMTCKFCSSPFISPENDGVAGEADPTVAVPVAPVQIMCPACQNLTPVPGNAHGGEHACAQCQKPIDLLKVAIEPLLGAMLSDQPSKIAGLAWAALSKRWAAGKLCVAEAADILFPMALLEGWVPPQDSADAPISPLKAAQSAELIKYLVFSMPDTLIGTMEGGATRMMIKLSLQGGFPWEELLRGPILERIRDSLTPMGAFRIPSKDKQPQMQPLFYLILEDKTEGCILSAQLQRPNGVFESFTDLSLIRIRIREKIIGAAHGYAAFRALYGMWATVQTMQSATVDGVAGKIAAVDGYQADSVTLARTILNRWQ
jgi:hypothetical protein